MSGTILDRIVASARRRLADSPPDRGALERAVADSRAPADALAALAAPGIRIIAEVKRRSPSAGVIRATADPASIAAGYAAAGAAAISVLTEPEHFGGSLDDLAAVAATVDLPCLRKDFIVDEVQLLEARAAGASLALLIVACLRDRELRALREAAEGLGLTCLVEAHDQAEVRRALDTGARVVGVNNRDLKTFAIDLAVAERLRPQIGDAAIAVAESGIRTRADLERLRAAGYDAFLVGSGLMQAPEPARALATLLTPEPATP